MKICPVCMSTEIGLHMGGIDGKYECRKCSYIGAIVLEKFRKDEESS